MDAFEAITTRRSIRHFTQEPISDELLGKLLTAGMSGPSCGNSRDWSFIVVRDKKMLHKMADGNGKPAGPLRRANIGILVCGDLGRSFKKTPDYWIIDSAIAAQNMILAAHALGLGSVWLGTYPEIDRVAYQSALFSLPDTVVPHSILAFGYPNHDAPEDPGRPAFDIIGYEEGRIHFERW